MRHLLQPGYLCERLWPKRSSQCPDGMLTFCVRLQGGGVRIDSGDVSFTSCSIYSNEATYVSAGAQTIFPLPRRGAHLLCLRLQGGGGFYIDSGDVSFILCSIYSNQAEWVSAAAHTIFSLPRRDDLLTCCDLTLICLP